jgi:hypothetical protein
LTSSSEGRAKRYSFCQFSSFDTLERVFTILL